MTTRTSRKTSLKSAHQPLSDGYWEASQRPLASLMFLLPLVIVYELGVLRYATYHSQGHTTSVHIVARSMLNDFLQLFGVTGYYLPGLLVVVVLICLHIVRGDRLRFEPRVYLWMLFESAALALPLFVFARVLARQPVMQWMLAADGGAPVNMYTHLPAGIVFSVGAGIYEELLFRLIGIAIVHAVLVDLLKFKHSVGAVGAIFVTAFAFAWYHFSENQPLHLGLFSFYVITGLYLAAVYVLRGFGIVAATHAMYDVLVVTLIATQHNS